MSSARRTTVLVVDDEALVRDGLVAIVGSHPDLEVVGTASDGAEAVRAAVAHRPDVVLMDVRMPGTDGIEATREILRAAPTTRVLVLTTVELDEVVDRALRAGASGFLLKSVPREQLWEGVRVVASGEALLAPRLTRRLIEAHLRHGDPDAGRALRLTARQVDVVRLVARGWSNAEIAAELHLAESTVTGYVGDVLAAHGLRDRVQLVVLAYESGTVRVGG